jgi:hypothetical protein
LCIVDTRFTDVLTVQITNVSGDAQVLAGVVYRRLDNAMAWAASTLADFSAIADGVSVVADMDVRGTGYIKITASYSGAGADAIVVARRRAI